MGVLVFLRHGQSQWNVAYRFTGWVDVDLTAQGEAEARRSGELLKDAGVAFDFGFTSVLTRAIRTANLALDVMGQTWLPLEKHWRLNERHYGALTGLDKAETAEKHGADQVKVWRRSYDTPPPPMPADHPDNMAGDRRYAGLPAGSVPNTESLATTLERVTPYWTGSIAPRVRAGETVLVAAHGNSLRALVKRLFDVPEDDIVKVEIPTGNPLVLTIAPGGETVQSARYLDASRATPIPEPQAA